METRVCRKCGIEKRITSFKKSKTCVSGRRKTCSLCSDPNGPARAERDKAKYPHAVYARRKALRGYGLTEEDYKRMFAQQDGKCALCGRGPKAGGRLKNLPVDHDHKTGKARGLLCTPCNRIVGLIESTPDMLEKVKAYLEGTLATLRISV